MSKIIGAVRALGDALPGWMWLLLFGAALTIAVIESDRHARVATQLAQAQATLADERASVARAALQSAADEHARERIWSELIQEVENDAHTQTMQAHADVIAARAVADGLRERIAAVIDHATTGAGSSDPGTTGGGTGIGSAGAADMLTDVFNRLIEAQRGTAEYADRLRIAGTACEGAYGALKR
jgi:hypothetical protein